MDQLNLALNRIQMEKDKNGKWLYPLLGNITFRTIFIFSIPANTKSLTMQELRDFYSYVCEMLAIEGRKRIENVLENKE